MSNCQLCGEQMPPGEEMFNYHGYSGPCPKPPLPKLPLTWTDIEKLSLYDPFVREWATRFKQGDISREQSLIGMVIVLSTDNDRLKHDVVDQMARCNCRTIESHLKERK